MAGPFLVGVDVGTTAVKTGVFDADGTLLSRRATPVATSRPAADRVEQAPADWLAATLDGLAHVLDGRSGRRARGRRPLQPGQHACVRRRRRGSAGAGDRLAGRTRSRGRRAARRARAGRGAAQMVGRAAADRCEPCPEPHGVDGADAPRGVAAHALGDGAEGLLPPRAHRRSLGRSALVLRRRRRIAQVHRRN